MAFLISNKKEHLIELAEELGLIVEASLTKPKLKDLIVKSPDYIEDDVKAWERVTLFGGVKETHSPNSVSCKQQEQGRCKNYSCNFRARRPPITL
ncbi:hypothetical protein TNCV_1098361 [Trichonephila clavipes]|nr:hypothetical protein TNCV_1098361 [Trichonephila clavipes]